MFGRCLQSVCLIAVLFSYAGLSAPPPDPDAVNRCSTLPFNVSAAKQAGLADADGTWTMGDPFSTASPTYAPVTHPLAPTVLWGKLGGPYPTNAAWMDFVLGAGRNTVNLLPYAVKALDSGLQISLPRRQVQPRFILSVFLHNLSFSSVEPLKDHALAGYDLLSVTVNWRGSGGGRMQAPLVRGMPYATMLYEGLTPRLATQHVILSVNDESRSPVTGRRFKIALNNGQTWVLYSSSDVTWEWTSTEMKATAPFAGFLRAAVADSGEALGLLDQYWSAYPTGGDVAVTVSGDLAAVRFDWRKAGSGSLLMMALPHHIDLLDGGERTNLRQRTLRGDMVGIVGDSWSLAETLVPISWAAPTGIDPDKVADIEAALSVDAAQSPAGRDPYFFGKQIAKLGRLALIADEIGEAATASAVRERMKSYLDPWLEGRNPDALKYDTLWGGICSSDGLAGSGRDFGQGYYNDHHFHYGYHIYAAAAIAKADPDWLAAQRAAVVDLIRDIANPSLQDPYFTPFRHMDWFEGHSWAAGLFPFGDARNQESTSEAVNAWYGVALFGLAVGDQNIANVGRVLLATEIRSAQKYWQIKQDSSIYEDPFAANKVVGVLWGNKVDYATFFGARTEFIHGIQMIPFTPASEALLAADWVAEEYSVLSQALKDPTISDGWRGYVYMDHAIIDPVTAWREVQTLQRFDDGNSRTNTLYWVATRPR